MEQTIALAETVTLSHRSTHVPTCVCAHRHLTALLNLARALERGDMGEVAAWDHDLQREPGIPDDTPTPVVSPSTRAKTLASVLIDLARSGWKISVEERQIYAVAPEWSVDAKGMSPEAVRAEKDRARAAMAGRIQEEIDSDRTRRFVLRMESPRLIEAGVRSVLSLIADGPALAASLRERGADAIRPVLQSAERAPSRILPARPHPRSTRRSGRRVSRRAGSGTSTPRWWSPRTCSGGRAGSERLGTSRSP